MAETVAFFRPDDERAAEAAEIVAELGAEPLSDPMLAVEPTGAAPREDAAVTVLTSKTGAELVSEVGWEPAGEVVAIGSATAGALTEAGYRVDRVAGRRVEIARSDHGSTVLTDGLADAGAYVHETVLYRLVRPEGAGEAAEAAAEQTLDGACFTSSLTVEHLLEAAADRGVREAAVAGLDDAVVGAIGEPTREATETHGIAVDVVPDTADFEALAAAVVERL
ncbi:uroporphyrinogen-III synthase [Halobacteriales archaeon QS_9_70_65]|nr:MAG: uroporphyrinogen-III synthase [Halobacteriales archaeon QS_9_70_65]